MPPVEHGRVQALVDDPLLRRMTKAEVTRLRPRREMPDRVNRLVEPIEAGRIRQIGIARAQRDDIMAVLSKRGDEMPAQKAGCASDQSSHAATGSTGNWKSTPRAISSRLLARISVSEVPGQHVIDVRWRRHVGLEHHRNVHAGRHQTAPQRVLLDQALDRVGADAEVVQEGVALHRRAEPENALATGDFRGEPRRVRQRDEPQTAEAKSRYAASVLTRSRASSASSVARRAPGARRPWWPTCAMSEPP